MKLNQLAYLLLILLPLNVFAIDDEARGLEIATEAEKRDAGWGDQSSTNIMTLRNRHGDESVRKIRTRTLEVNGGGDKSLVLFDAPADIKGTVFLTHSHAKKSDDQWIYLPALKRVKRISSANKSGPFMGSEFAYEDIAPQGIEKYRYKYLKDEEINGFDTYVIEQHPEYKNSGYTRQLVWMDKKMYQVIKIDFYDRKNTLLKTLSFYDFKQYLKKYWRADRMEMVNHQTNKSTTLVWENYQFQSGFSQRDFDRNILKRAR
ncbi:Outer membrane lipoprotein-sorting protein [hydrothermal vent metagenome]|uniref:Outer membrane lipoprotein-sorting protein n=1 Tax=hydrothermal vent metagenome TaxID=652676 RepID=A0A3B0Z9E0_9ZZZZ